MTRAKTRTAALERKIHNQHRRMLRSMESRDMRRLFSVRDALPQIEAEVADHNRQLVLEAVVEAGRQAQALAEFISWERPKIEWRRSYAFDFWLEGLALGKHRLANKVQ